MAKISEQAVQKLRVLLASWTVFRHKVHSYHWNVDGHNFNPLHDKFHGLYDLALEHVDTMAERLKQIGEAPVNTLTEVLALTQVPDVNTTGSDEDMVNDTLSVLNVLSNLQTDLWADSVEDSVTNDIMIQLNKTVEFELWQLGAWIKK